ncbi:hypothetical protein [Hydrogenophaga sp. PBC]|nr:hypothetical protein [Hydrogenophaga sp. PBC]
MTDLLPWMNLLLVPVIGLLLNIERRLTRLEALREADSERRRLGVHTVT